MIDFNVRKRTPWHRGVFRLGRILHNRNATPVFDRPKSSRAIVERAAKHYSYHS
jgi:hypothetical protein